MPFHVFGSHTYTERGATAQPLTVTIADVGGAVSNATSYTPTVAEATSLSFSAASGQATYGGTASLAATLTAGGIPVPNETVRFSLDGAAVGTATTDGSGVATLPGVSLAGLSAGDYGGYLAASFAGDIDYMGSRGTGDLAVNKATPTLSWARPAPIAYGTALSGAQLDASASWTVGGTVQSVAGTCVYTPAVGAMLAPGSQTLSTTFTPADSTDYTTATKSVTLTVNQAPSMTSQTSAAFPVGKLGSFTVTTTGYPAAVLTESGTLPRGVTFVDNGDGTATLSGTPAPTTGNYIVSITANNRSFPAVAQMFTLAVIGPPTITSTASAAFTVGKAGSFTITTTPGLPATTTLSESGTLPSGVSFKVGNNGTATLSGTPGKASGGAYPFTISASNALGVTTQAFTLSVNQGPAITSAAAATFMLGKAGLFTVTTTGYPAAKVTWSGSYPSWCRWEDNGDGTAALTGTPTATGVYTFTINAANGVSSASPQTFKLTVDQAPTITTAASAAFTVGKAGSFTITTTPGLPATTTLSESGTLPSGVKFKAGNNGTATLSGTPANGSGGVFKLTISASNAASSVTTQAFTLTVNQGPAITSAASATFMLGKAGLFTVTTAGFPAAKITWSGSYPSWCQWEDNGDGTAALTGMPTAAGVYTFTINAANSVSSASPQTFKLTVLQSPTITSAASAAFAVGKAATFTITTTPGLPATTTLSESGTLPSGVKFKAGSNGTATLSGTPASGSGGVYKLTISASNAASSVTTQAFTLTVNQGPAITSAAAATFTVGKAGLFAVTTTGFPAAKITWSGSYPSWCQWADNGDGTATLSGTPTATGVYTFTINAANSVSSAPAQTFKLTVNQPAIITTANAATFTIGQTGSFTVATGGSPTATLSESGSLPKGVSFKAGANGTATFSGTPAAGTAGTYIFTITASNGVSPGSVQLFTLTVAATSGMMAGTAPLDVALHDAAMMAVLADSGGEAAQMAAKKLPSVSDLCLLNEP